MPAISQITIPAADAPRGGFISNESGSGFAGMLKKIDEAQLKMDGSIRTALSSPEIRPVELLALQASMYRSSLELDLAGKVVEKVSSGIRQTLSTNT